jgi:hypothetical protein
LRLVTCEHPCGASTTSHRLGNRPAVPSHTYSRLRLSQRCPKLGAAPGAAAAQPPGTRQVTCPCDFLLTPRTLPHLIPPCGWTAWAQCHRAVMIIWRITNIVLRDRSGARWRDTEVCALAPALWAKDHAHRLVFCHGVLTAQERAAAARLITLRLLVGWVREWEGGQVGSRRGC